MTRMSRSISGILLVLLAVLLTTNSAYGAKWEPFNFQGDEAYRYQVNWTDDSEQSAIYELRIEENNSGDFVVKYSTEIIVSASELSSQTVFGFWGGYGPSLNFLFLNPMYEMLFSQLELEVGEKMSFYGQGTMEVLGMESIAGINGYVCRYSGSEEEIRAEWVIDPDLPLPLRSRMYEGSNVRGELELTYYEKL